MKKVLLYSIVAAATLGLSSCSDFLDDNRYPLTSQTNSPEYWNNPSNVKGQTDTFYGLFLGYGNGGGYGNFYFNTLTDDQASNSFATWENINIPSSSSSWKNPWINIRHASYVITNVSKSSLTATDRDHFLAIARLVRANQYFELVKRYGDVQWVDGVVEISDKDVVYGKRQDRDEIMDKVLEDLNFACEHMKDGSNGEWNKDMANAMKSDICLWEGSYCKYRTQEENGKPANEERAKKFFEESIKASQNVINAGYELSEDYQALYNSLDLSRNPEVIFQKAYSQATMRHSLISYTCSSTQISGMTKDAFDAYLFKDGKPLATTTCNKSDLPEVTTDENGKQVYSIEKLLAERDARLAATIDPVIFYQDMTWSRAGGMQMTSSTGYGIKKYDNVTLPAEDRRNTTQNYTCAPLYWLSVVYLNYAEAKAELGQLTQTDVDNTIGKLYTRAKLPVLNIEAIEPDPNKNMDVSDLLWEIRRCRRCELIMDNDYRYWDLVRWHKLDLLDSQKYPNILLGANMKDAPVTIGNVNGYVDGSKGKVRLYDKRQYLWPIPSGQITLNPNLEQNPLWK